MVKKNSITNPAKRIGMEEKEQESGYEGTGGSRLRNGAKLI